MRRETAARQRLAARALQGFNIQSHPNSPHLWLHLPATHPWRDLISKSHATPIKLASTEAFATDNNIPHAIRVCLGGAANHAVLGDGLRELTDILLSPSEAHQPVLT